MPDDVVSSDRSSAKRLAAWIHRGLRNSVTNGYSTLSSRELDNNIVYIRVKDARNAKMLTITITEDKA